MIAIPYIGISWLKRSNNTLSFVSMAWLCEVTLMLYDLCRHMNWKIIGGFIFTIISQRNESLFVTTLFNNKSLEIQLLTFNTFMVHKDLSSLLYIQVD